MHHSDDENENAGHDAENDNDNDDDGQADDGNADDDDDAPTSASRDDGDARRDKKHKRSGAKKAKLNGGGASLSAASAMTSSSTMTTSGGAATARAQFVHPPSQHRPALVELALHRSERFSELLRAGDGAPALAETLYLSVPMRATVGNLQAHIAARLAALPSVTADSVVISASFGDALQPLPASLTVQRLERQYAKRLTTRLEYDVRR